MLLFEKVKYKVNSKPKSGVRNSSTYIYVCITSLLFITLFKILLVGIISTSTPISVSIGINSAISNGEFLNYGHWLNFSFELDSILLTALINFLSIKNIWNWRSFCISAILTPNFLAIFQKIKQNNTDIFTSISKNNAKLIMFNFTYCFS
jgi:hypothetical protein